MLCLPLETLVPIKKFELAPLGRLSTNVKVKMSQCKKNLQGGKAHKGRSSKENSNHRKNRELGASYVDDILAGEKVEEITLACVTRVQGGARAELLTSTGETIVAGLKGSLKCSKGAARRSDNPLAMFTGSYVLLQRTDYGFQNVAVLSSSDRKAIEPHIECCKGFFGTETEDCGIDWEEEVDVDAL